MTRRAVVGHVPQVGALQGSEPVIRGRIEMGDRQVLLQKRDRRQEAAALQPIAVEILWGDVGGCDQRDAPPEQRLNQPGQDHGVTDVTHEKLIETQHYRVVCDVLRNRLKRVFGAAVAGECSVDTLHKPVKMHPKLALNRQTVEKRIDEVRLTSAHPSPKVEAALWPLGSAQKPLGSAPNGVPPR